MRSSPTNLRTLGSHKGTVEAAKFVSCTPKPISQSDAYARLNQIVSDGRYQLQQLNVPDHDIETWEIACRISYLLATVKERNVGML